MLLDVLLKQAHPTGGVEIFKTGVRPESLTTGQDMSYLDIAAELTNSRVRSNRHLVSQGNATYNTAGTDVRGDITPTLGVQSCGVSDDLNMTAKELAVWKKRQTSIQADTRRAKANLTTAPNRLG